MTSAPAGTMPVSSTANSLLGLARVVQHHLAVGEVTRPLPELVGAVGQGERGRVRLTGRQAAAPPQRDGLPGRVAHRDPGQQEAAAAFQPGHLGDQPGVGQVGGRRQRFQGRRDRLDGAGADLDPSDVGA